MKMRVSQADITLKITNKNLVININGFLCLELLAFAKEHCGIKPTAV